MAHENATPRPWYVEGAGNGVTIRGMGEKKMPIAEIWHNGDHPAANASLIVEAVNAYDTLRAEVDQCAIELEEAANVFDGRGFHGLARVYRGASLRARAVLSEAQP